MENILQSIVKIIIIGVLYENVIVECNRQYLPPPPLPYYQNEDYYVPGFAPAFVHEQLPVYYPERKISPAISYQNVNSYTPPQLFYQNENYVPPSAASPGLRYPQPQVFPFKQNFQQTKPRQKLNFGFARVEYKKPTQTARPQVPHKKTEAFASNIIVKEEPLTPYYQDDYNKNYDDDYIDNYSDDTPTTPKPCASNSPYRYFQPPQGASNSPDKYTLCNPYFQPDFGNGVYTVKMPITLLPSQFPPRVEQLIERIQNYFSTYTQQQTSKPVNATAPASTTQTPAEASSESATPLSVTEVVSNQNKTGENAQETGTQPTIVADVERITQKTIVVAIEESEPEASSTTAPDAQPENQSQLEEQTTQTLEEYKKIVPDAAPENPQTNAEAGTGTEGQVVISPESTPVSEVTNADIGKAENTEEKKEEPVRVQNTPAEDATKVNETSPKHSNGPFHDVTSNNG